MTRHVTTNSPMQRRFAEAIANDVPLRESEYFTRTRKRIRDALTEHGNATRPEELAADLLISP